MNRFPSHLGRLIRDSRKASGLTQIELATAASVALSAVRTVEVGRGRASTLDAIVAALGLELRGRSLQVGRIGAALVRARRARKISQRQLARSLGVSRNTLAATERGGGLVSTLEAYAAAVGAGLYLARPHDPRPFMTHTGNSTGNDLWQTPVELAVALSKAVGGFDCDPCAATRDRRRARVKARLLLTAADDGLNAPWPRGKIFVNPPYSRGMARWIRKCRAEGERGAVVVGLIPARVDTNYWHDDVAGKADIFMLRGRLKFGDSDTGAPFPSALVVWGAGPDVVTRIAAAVPDAWHIPRPAQSAADLAVAQRAVPCHQNALSSSPSVETASLSFAYCEPQAEL